MESIFAILMALLLGITALSVGFKTVRVSRQVKRWPTVPGTVIERAAELSAAGTVDTSGARYRAAVRYTYDVAGQTYIGTAILAYGTLTGTREAMQAYLDGLTNPVTLHFNPANPAESCLQAQPAWWAYGALAAGMLRLGVALLMAVTR